MPQGKMKIKVKANNVIKKKKPKGDPITKRTNAPVKSRKANSQGAAKLKKAVTNAVNAAAEEELRSLAYETAKSSSKKKK